MNEELKNAIIANKMKTSSLNGWYKVDPAFAIILLSLNVSNYRKMDKAKVSQYAQDMMTGKWHRNGESIVVGPNGILQDGQHRLAAIIKANVAIEVYIVFDSDETTLYNIYKSRTIKDAFDARGAGINTLNISTGNAYLHYGSGRKEFGKAYQLDFIEKHIDTIKMADSIVCSSSGKVGRKAACAALVYCFLKTNKMSETDLRMFFNILNSGNTIGCTKDPSPALVARRQFQEMLDGGGRGRQKYQLEVLYKALNDFRTGSSRRIAYKFDADDAERFVREVYESENDVEGIAA